MKKFVGIESARPIRGTYTIDIYKVCRDGLAHVAQGKICYASTRGETSEVMTALAQAGQIPKKYERGYYSREYPFIIQYITPRNQK